MKRRAAALAVAAVMAMSMGMTAFAGETEGAASADLAADITLWTYPVGGYGNSENVDGLIKATRTAMTRSTPRSKADRHRTWCWRGLRDWSQTGAQED